MAIVSFAVAACGEVPPLAPPILTEDEQNKGGSKGFKITNLSYTGGTLVPTTSNPVSMPDLSTAMFSVTSFMGTIASTGDVTWNVKAPDGVWTLFIITEPNPPNYFKMSSVTISKGTGTVDFNSFVSFP
ncbi:MAG: hypothetical protein LBD22_03750 [Spirochaetaceae bacterium]|jgi:hypothetical protein|nr:hypothetical protein [Spirochaetaceae bacterium]